MKPPDITESPTGESLLAFKIGADGKFRLLRDFKDERDKLALLQYAQSVIRTLSDEIGLLAIRS